MQPDANRIFGYPESAPTMIAKRLIHSKFHREREAGCVHLSPRNGLYG